MSIIAAGLVGLGIFLMWLAATAVAPLDPLARARASAWHQRTRENLRLAGYRSARIGQLIAVSCGSTLSGGLVAFALTKVMALAVLAGALAGAGPWQYVRQRARAHLKERRDAWPDAVDHVASAVRAGLSIPESLRQLAEHGPEVLREDFAAFARHDAAHGRFDDSLDVLKESLADPAADRLIESLRLARNVGGTDVGRLLRTLSAFLREDASTRAELAARQSWTISAARLALAAPWLALLIVGFRGNGFAAYQTSTGVLVLIVGTLVSWAAYLAMKTIGRLPLEERVMRS